MGTQLLSDDATLGEISREDKEVIVVVVMENVLVALWFATCSWLVPLFSVFVIIIIFKSVVPDYISHSLSTLYSKGSSRGGRLRLLLDVPPPVDKDTFDPSTVVPSTSEGLLESYCSNLMAMQQMQMALSKASSGDPSPFVSQG